MTITIHETAIRDAVSEAVPYRDDLFPRALLALDALMAAFRQVEQERDSWRRVAREYETALADRGLL